METLIRRLEHAMMAVAVLCMVAMMLIISYDALSRYALNAPLPWSFDFVTYYLMIIVTYFAVSATYQQGDHVAVDLFYNMISKRMRARVSAVTSLTVAVMFVFIAYGAWIKTATAYQGREFIPGYFNWPVWLSYLPIPIGSGVLVLRLLHHAYTLIRHGADPYVVEHGETVD